MKLALALLTAVLLTPLAPLPSAVGNDSISPALRKTAP